jgi:hypothetical protein
MLAAFDVLLIKTGLGLGLNFNPANQTTDDDVNDLRKKRLASG